MTVIDDDDLEQATPRKPRRLPPPRVRGETERTKEVLDWLNARPDTYAMKKHTSVQGQGGHPDVFACVAGRMFLVEMKRPGYGPDDRQMQRLRDWQDAGAAVCWASSVEHVRELVDRLDDPDYRNPLTGPGAPLARTTVRR